MGQQQIKAGDRVIVVEPANGGCSGRYFRAGNTGTLLANGLVKFDAQPGVKLICDRTWSVGHDSLRRLTFARRIRALFARAA